MATTKTDTTLKKHKQRSRKYRARITNLQAKLEAVDQFSHPPRSNETQQSKLYHL
jgi:hypothetical protein